MSDSFLSPADRGIDCPRPVRNKAGKTYSIETFRENGEFTSAQRSLVSPSLSHSWGKATWNERKDTISRRANSPGSVTLFQVPATLCVSCSSFLEKF